MFVICIHYFPYLWTLFVPSQILLPLPAHLVLRIYLTRSYTPHRRRRRRVHFRPTQSDSQVLCLYHYLKSPPLPALFALTPRMTHLAAVVADTAVPGHGVPPQWDRAVWLVSRVAVRIHPSRGTILCTSSGWRWCSCPYGSPSWTSMSSSGRSWLRWLGRSAGFRSHSDEIRKEIRVSWVCLLVWSGG